MGSYFKNVIELQKNDFRKEKLSFLLAWQHKAFSIPTVHSGQVDGGPLPICFHGYYIDKKCAKHCFQQYLKKIPSHILL